MEMDFLSYLNEETNITPWLRFEPTPSSVLHFMTRYIQIKIFSKRKEIVDIRSMNVF